MLTLKVINSKCEIFKPIQLDTFVLAETRYKHPRKLTSKISFMDSSSETDTSENTKKYPMSKQFSTSSDGCESDDYSSPRPVVSRSNRR